MIDPIEREGFSIHKGREPNMKRIKRIRHLARQRHLYDHLLTIEIREAINSGHSYRQVAAAAGMSPTGIKGRMKDECLG